jgi:predicted RNA-binding protein
MCEFSVLLGGEEVFKDAIYAKADESKVILKDVLGNSKALENCRITEINVSSERLVLSSIEAS